MTCPLWTGKTCRVLLDSHGITELAGPGSPNHPCETCQSEWTDGPPTADTLTPTLTTLLVFANPEPLEPPWDISQPSRGLGDDLARLLSAVGIRKRHGCGCGRKIDWLNKRFPYRRRTA